MSTKAATRSESEDESGDPVSVRFPSALRRRAERYAKGRHMKLATAIRAIVAEHLEDADVQAHLSRAGEWQRRQAWATAQTLVRGTPIEASWEALRESHAAGVARLARSKKRR